MLEHWKELVAGLAVLVAGAAGGVYATTVHNEATIEVIQDDISYLRSRVDAIYDRLPAKEAR